MYLSILGNGSGGPFHGRHYTAQVLQVGSHTFLIDCGEGTQMQLFRYRIRYDACQHIFISHLHGDHVFGLMGLLTNWCLKKRSEPLHLYSPPGLRELVDTFTRVCAVRFTYELRFHEVDTTHATQVLDLPTLEVSTLPLNHRSPTTGWLFREKTRPRNMLREQIEMQDIPRGDIPAIKAGADWVRPDGSIVANAALTRDPMPPRAYAFCSDTAFSPAVAEAVRGVDLLYHEATFTQAHLAEAEFSCHSTAAQAAEVAQMAGVGRLLLGHFSGRYSHVDQHLAEARAIFPRTDAAQEGWQWAVGSEQEPLRWADRMAECSVQVVS